MAASRTMEKEKAETLSPEVEAPKQRFDVQPAGQTGPVSGRGTVGVREIEGESAVPQTETSGGGNRLAIISLIVCVALPFLLACAYYFVVATDQYVAEARFAVRSLGGGDEESSGSSGGRLMRTAALDQDAYVVTSFIHSTEMLRRLEERVDLRDYFQRGDIDFLARLDEDATREDLLEYWSGQVSTYIDGPSGIITLHVRAHSPDDARELTQMIVEESEILVNQLSERARADYIRRADAEVAQTATRYEESLTALNAFQNESRIFSPEAQATETGSLLTGLLSQKLEVDSRLFVLRQNNISDSPQARQLERTQASLDNQINELRGELASGDTADSNLSSYLRQFASLETDRLLASGLYEAARRNLAEAEMEAHRQAIYVTVFVEPSIPEDSLYPKRLQMPLLILLGLSLMWGIGALIYASVEDHRG